MTLPTLNRGNEIQARLGEIDRELQRLPSIIAGLKSENAVGILGIRFDLPKQAIQGQLNALENKLQAERNQLQNEFDNL